MSAPPKGINTLTVPGRRRRSMNTLTVPAARDGQTVANAYTLPPKDKVIKGRSVNNVMVAFLVGH
ncbi:hypothetical protein FOZ62_009052 [Perkinsus olseni]|uniref:Uncharacterized protein n=1 Tax=Perkinsus olseni TaxID=32597 RepID=A0A7J6QJB2_PEROL|nr:hypothetical protein FOZ62_009052 [Perkinsus olseni]